VSVPQKSRSRLLKGVVEANLDFIHDRLPAPLRPARRWLRAAVSLAGRAGLSIAVLLVASGAGSSQHGPDAQQWSASISREIPDAVAAADALTPSVGTSRFSPGVLALGVRRVVIDAGHGGEDPGTMSAGGLAEKTVTLDIALRLRSLIVGSGLEAVMTRQTDETVSLQARVATANARRGDLFVSIHINSFQRDGARGIETYYVGPNAGPELDAIAERENQNAGYSLADLRTLLDRVFADARREESRRLARAVQYALVRTAQQTDPDIANRGVKTASFVVLAAAEMPAILAEVACLSNPTDARQLETPEYRQQIAKALASAVTGFAWSRGTAHKKGQDVSGN
jgi:N-acetylmuramoyl-L-alanine amidase